MGKYVQGPWRKKSKTPHVALPLRPLRGEYGPNVVEFPDRVAIQCVRIMKNWKMYVGG